MNMPATSRPHALALAALALMLLSPCAVLAGDPAEVRIENYQFVPAELEVLVGTTVRWINDEKRTSHSVLFTQEGGLESERMMPEDSWERTFDKPGVYPYTCTPHPEMSGVIKVIEAPPAP